MERNRLNGHYEDSATIQRPTLSAADEKKRFVLRLKARQQDTFLSYSEKPWGIGVHYDRAAGRSEGHYEPSADCPGCARKLPHKELYYIFGQDLAGKFCFLELPDGAARHIQRLLPPGTSMRGQRFHLQRGESKNARLSVRVLPAYEHPEALPRDEDPIYTLELLWAEKRPPGWPFRELCDGPAPVVLNGKHV